MNRTEAFTVITETCRSQKRFGGTFAVFYDQEDELSVMHLTHRRADILGHDLQNKFGPTRKGLVGIYDRHLDVDHLYEDIDYVVQEHKAHEKILG